ncbi:MAG: 2-oxoacid:ferredoxin oxidoreductase subunit alpha [Sulfolobaceae archaeon]
MKVSWLIGGAQGTGIDTAASIFGNAVALAGYYVFGNREYHSNIKGRHSYFSLSISDKKVYSIALMQDIIASYDAETIFQHFREANKIVIYNKQVESTKIDNVQSMEFEIAEEVEKFLREKGYGTTVKEVIRYLEDRGIKVIGINYDEIAKKAADAMKVPLSVAERVKNIVAVAVSTKILGLDIKYLLTALRRTFKNETFYKLNVIGAEVSYSLVDSYYELKEIKREKKRYQLDGNTAVALGKIRAGLRFQSYYPITPAADESMYIEAHQEVYMIDPETGEKRKGTIVVVQSEDELSAINMASGAALAGVRASTATSGPGFSLMVEGLGWAGMNEVPIVITYYMRGGPSTGLPTRTSQADLLFSMFAGHGEFPRIVIASGDHVEAFHDAMWAFNLAERYQTPVIHLVEKAIANSYRIVDDEELKEIYQPDRGKLLDEVNGDYKRFKFVEDGISPRAVLGKAIVYYTGDEHNEDGFISEAPTNRLMIYEKRMKKLEVADREIPEELRVNIFGDIDSEIFILTWGSPKGALLDIYEELRKEGIKFGVLQIRMFSPFPKNIVKKVLSNKRMIIDIENNYMAQAGMLTKLFTGIEPTNYILKWNGRPIFRDELSNALKSVIINNEKKVILNGGA